MPQFLIDANLPFKISCWKSDRFLHVLKINPLWDDNEIWQYALIHKLTIVSKDKDFSVKQFIEGSPPKLVHIKFGNLKLSDFINRVEHVWNDVEKLLENHSVVNIYLSKLESIK